MATQHTYTGLISLIVCTGMCSLVTAQEKLRPDLAGKHVLFVYGGWEGHHPEACRDLYVPWLHSQGAMVTISDSLGIYTDSLLMAQQDLIIQIWTMGEISQQQLNGLLQAVEQGTGLAGWHGGIGDAFRNEPAYQFMVGGQWVAHPGGVIDYTVRVTDPSDPIMTGIQDFVLHTEQYYMHVDPNVHVLATTSFTGEHAFWLSGRTMPVMWKTTYGLGRIFFNAIGHQMEDHAVPEFALTMRRGIRWACR